MAILPGHPHEPGAGGRQPGAADGHHQRQAPAAKHQQLDERLLARVMRQGVHGRQLV
jgi:hypothetical protein